MYNSNRDIARYESIFINFERASYEIQETLANFHYENEILRELLDSVELGGETSDSEFRRGIFEVIRELTDDPRFWDYPYDFSYHSYPFWPYPFRRLFAQLELEDLPLRNEYEIRVPIFGRFKPMSDLLSPAEKQSRPTTGSG